MQKLSFRLQCALNEIGQVDTFADIGTDHGQLILYALTQNCVKRAFAVDISEKSLEKAKQAINEFGLADRVDFFVGDGLKPLSTVPSVVVVAGMGGNEIVNILNDVSIDTKFVLIPHHDAHVLREYLCNNKYQIEKDYIIKDNKFYAVIVATRGHTDYSRSQIILGADNPHTDFFRERLLDRKKRIEWILKNNTKLNQLQPEMQEEYEEINKCLE